jgi:hypothetical protein
MYLNLALITDKEYNLTEVFVMQLLKQNRSEDLEEYLAYYLSDPIIERFEKENILTSIKKKKKSDSGFSVMRLSKKGLELLDLMETPEITVGDEDMVKYLCEMYLANEDEERVIGNKKKVRIYCTVFRKRMNLTLHEMYYLCLQFLEDYKYTKKLQNIFFDENKHRYGTFEGNFEDSPLYQYLDQNREKIEQLWKHRIKES